MFLLLAIALLSTLSNADGSYTPDDRNDIWGGFKPYNSKYHTKCSCTDGTAPCLACGTYHGIPFYCCDPTITYSKDERCYSADFPSQSVVPLCVLTKDFWYKHVNLVRPTHIMEYGDAYAGDKQWDGHVPYGKYAGNYDLNWERFPHTTMAIRPGDFNEEHQKPMELEEAMTLCHTRYWDWAHDPYDQEADCIGPSCLGCSGVVCLSGKTSPCWLTNNLPRESLHMTSTTAYLPHDYYRPSMVVCVKRKDNGENTCERRLSGPSFNNLFLDMEKTTCPKYAPNDCINGGHGAMGMWSFFADKKIGKQCCGSYDQI